MMPPIRPNAVKHFRGILGLTQRELAEKCGITITTYQRVESGFTIPKLKLAKKICAALNNRDIHIVFPTGLHRPKRKHRTTAWVLTEKGEEALKR